MKLNKNNVLDYFIEKVNDSLYPLKMGGYINESSVKELLEIAEEATRIFRDESLVPKKLLSEMYLVSLGFESENVYVKNDLLSFVSERVLDCFNLILAGQSIDDKKQNGPRII